MKNLIYYVLEKYTSKFLINFVEELPKVLLFSLLKKDPYLLKYVKNPTDEMVLFILKEKPHENVFSWIDNWFIIFSEKTIEKMIFNHQKLFSDLSFLAPDLTNKYSHCLIDTFFLDWVRDYLDEDIVLRFLKTNTREMILHYPHIILKYFTPKVENKTIKLVEHILYKEPEFVLQVKDNFLSDKSLAIKGKILFKKKNENAK